MPRPRPFARSEEHTSELQSRENLVCRLLLEKKKKKGQLTRSPKIRLALRIRLKRFSGRPGIRSCICFFFFNDPATTEIYTLSLHDALPISPRPRPFASIATCSAVVPLDTASPCGARSAAHTSELQSREKVVCRLLLEK